MPLALRDPIYQGKLQMSDTTQFVEINPDAQLILRLPKAPCFARAHFPRVPIHLDISSYQPPEGEFDTIICSFRVQALRTQEAEDFIIQLHLFGEKVSDVYWSFDPASVLSSNLKELSNEDFELLSWCAFPSCGFRSGVAPLLADSLWQDTLGKLAMCRQQSLARVIKGSGYLSTRRLDMLLNQKHPPPSFPILTSNVSTTSRPAGQNGRFKHLNQVQVSRPPKCERWFKDKGLIPSGYQLGTRAIAQTMGFPSSWFEGLTERYSKNQTIPSQSASRRLASRTCGQALCPRGDDLRGCAAPQAESEQDTSQDEQLHQFKQPLPSAESLCEAVSFRATSTVLLGGDNNSPLSTENSSSVNKEISIPCLVKQPKQPEVKGVIRKDEGDRFVVDVDGKEISVSKLFVYPDFSKSVGQIEKSPRKNITPSKENPRKSRRKKGQGNGTIYYRTVTKNGKEYQEAYYHYTENGKKRTKYIPKKLLDRVKEAESLKLPISEILILLGGDKKNPRKSSSTSIDKVEQKINDGCVEKVVETNDLNPRKTTPPSKRRRNQGEGSGWIECKPIKRSGKEYKQYWYHYEEWREGDRVSKKSRYIPKRLVAKVEKMETDKVTVREILEVLKVKGK